MFDNLKGYLRDCNPKKTDTQKKVPLTLCPKNGQDLFSANHVNTTSGTKVTGINKMITSEKVLWSFNKFSQLIFQENVGKFIWRICMWIFGLKGWPSFVYLISIQLLYMIWLPLWDTVSLKLAQRSERERERERPWLGLVMWLQNKINSEGGVLCLTILCLVHAMIAKVRKGKTYNYNWKHGKFLTKQNCH